MATFRGNPVLTLEQNLYDLRTVSRVGDIYIEGDSKYKRIDARKSRGDAWELIK